ncbi:unnamed protein product [Mytilus edulis]|uniref:Uncharacterized protein n=1 Tax=Mytilus edulis TaxID=6550 RepID=A0A8S3RQ59_MYTED|nr:unnamed protein product [Mytilus edulis]
MTHSPQTADRHYNMINQRNNAMMVTNLIATVMVPMKIANIVELPDDTATNSTCESQIAHTAPTKAISNSIHWPVVTEMEKKETPMDKMNEEDFERDEKDKEIDLEATTFDGEDSQKDDEDYREVNDDILDSQKGHHKRRSLSRRRPKYCWKFVPWFPDWFNIVYDNDSAVYTYNHLEKDFDDAELQIFV